MKAYANTSKPWYREPWPWLLAIMPLTAVVAGSITLWFAITTNDGLVVDDYYKQGKAINQTKERDRLAREHGIQAELIASSRTLHLKLDGNLPAPPGQLNLRIMHPTRSGDDHAIKLNWDGAAYAGELPVLAAAHYKLELSPEFGDWRLTGDWHTGSPATLIPQL